MDKEGITIILEEIEGHRYINATELTRSSNRMPKDWYTRMAGKEHVTGICDTLNAQFITSHWQYRGANIPEGTVPIDLIIVGRGRGSKTLVHQALLPIFLRWLDKGLINMVDDWLRAGGKFDALLELLATFDCADMPPDRFIYVAQEVTSGRYKVGISKHPSERVKQLNVGNPEQLRLVMTYEATEAGYLSESLVHKKLGRYHMRSEWFSSDADLKLIKPQ